MELGLQLSTFVGQLVSFALLVLLVMRFGYKPIRHMLDERSRRIRESMDQAEAARKEYERAQAEYEQKVAEAREEARTILSQAEQAAEKLKRQAASEAEQHAQGIVQKARHDFEAERREIIETLRGEFVDVAILAAEKVIRQTVDRKKHLALIEEVLQESDTFRRDGQS
jgi:F-type H+-transporting ATPase subunit b